MIAGEHNAKAEECTTPYMRQNGVRWVGYMATKVAKNSPAGDRMRKQFTSYLLPFLMNTNTS